ncbi:MAG: hypothetical protein ACI97A_000726 [Planctomycetota bacterium]|jgi:hypothetical protein
MTSIRSILIICGFSLLTIGNPMNAQDVTRGLFAVSSEGTGAAGHGIKDRKFSVVAAPKVDNLKSGWNYLRNAAGKKHGLQIYVDKKRVSIEHFNHGVRLATGSFRSGKASGWIHYFDAKKKKHGLQHYFDSSYRSYENYNHGVKIAAGSYRDSRPDGWFYFHKNGKRDGIQKYVAKIHWSFDTYKNGQRDGTSGTVREGVRDGWYYEWKQGKKIGRVYYKMGKRQ